MKAIIVLAIVLVAANTYTVWDNWHGVPAAWVPNPTNPTSSVANAAGFTRNLPGNTHYSGYFSNMSQVYSQYMYWSTSNPDTLLFCAPKFYLYNETVCRKDPYYHLPFTQEFCLPNTFNHDTYPDLCSSSHPYSAYFSCCYLNEVILSPPFERDFYSIDPYGAPLL